MEDLPSEIISIICGYLPPISQLACLCVSHHLNACAACHSPMERIHDEIRSRLGCPLLNYLAYTGAFVSGEMLAEVLAGTSTCKNIEIFYVSDWYVCGDGDDSSDLRNIDDAESFGRNIAGIAQMYDESPREYCDGEYELYSFGGSYYIWRKIKASAWYNVTITVGTEYNIRKMLETEYPNDRSKRLVYYVEDGSDDDNVYPQLDICHPADVARETLQPRT